MSNKQSDLLALLNLDAKEITASVVKEYIQKDIGNRISDLIEDSLNELAEKVVKEEIKSGRLEQLFRPQLQELIKTLLADSGDDLLDAIRDQLWEGITEHFAGMSVSFTLKKKDHQ